MQGIAGITQAIMSAGRAATDPPQPDVYAPAPTAVAAAPEQPAEGGSGFIPGSIRYDPLLEAVMRGNAAMQSHSQTQRAIESAVDEKMSAPPMQITMKVPRDGSKPLLTMRNLHPDDLNPGASAAEVQSAASAPYQDANASIASLQQKEADSVARYLEQVMRGEVGDKRSTFQRFTDSVLVGAGMKNREQVRLEHMSPAERELYGVEKVLPVVKSMNEERRQGQQETRYEQQHGMAVEQELERFNLPENIGKYPDAGTALRAAQQEFGQALTPERTASVVTAFSQAGEKLRTAKLQRRNATIAGVKPEDVALYQNADDYIADHEDPDNLFTFGERSRMTSRFKAAQQEWQNKTQKERQALTLQQEDIAVKRAQVAAAEHANKINEATSNAAVRGLSGEQAIASLPPDVQNTVRGIAAGRLDISKITTMRGGNREAVANLVSAYDPTWSTATAPARAATYKDFTSGPTANKITAINTAVHHLDTLAAAAKDLQNASPQLWNRIANGGLTAVGDARVTKFSQAANAISAELAKAYGGGEATDSARNAWQSNFSAIQSPAQLKGAVDMAVSLLGGASAAIKDRYVRGMGKDDTTFHILSNDSRRVMEKRGINPDVVEGTSSQSAASGASPKIGDTKTFPNGNVGKWDGHGWVHVDGAQ
jgi:hypothetical protein